MTLINAGDLQDHRESQGWSIIYLHKMKYKLNINMVK